MRKTCITIFRIYRNRLRKLSIPCNSQVSTALLELSNEFKLGERTFNPVTGAVISGPDSPLEMITHSDQPDYFDEGEIENEGKGLGQVA